MGVKEEYNRKVEAVVGKKNSHFYEKPQTSSIVAHTHTHTHRPCPAPPRYTRMLLGTISNQQTNKQTLLPLCPPPFFPQGTQL